jgi:predicted dehydrogenase
MAQDINRRTFLGSAAASAAAFTIIPRHALGGPGYVAPSDKITMAYVGCGTQGIREMLQMLALPDLQIVAVCDPNKDSTNYVDWSRNGMTESIRRTLEKPDWRAGIDGIPGGRDVAKEIIETYYAAKRSSENFKGCTPYADFREMLEKEKDVDAVKVITPDHLHATIAIAAMEKGKHVMMHKPIANRLSEARWVIETARRTKVVTHFQPASPGEQIKTMKEWINDGVIGTLREVHNWSARPFWPQYPTVPTDTPPVPKDFVWDLWLGPSLDRPYHPHYTHAVFRGWYEFGGGPVADMGHYSLWPVFQEFDLDAPVLVESTPSHVCSIVDQVSRAINNDYSFPVASTIRYKFAAKGSRGPIEIFWYDGGMKPRTPEELEGENKELDREGMMLVGDKGKILAGFRGENPQIIPESKMRQYRQAKGIPEPPPDQERRRGQRQPGEPRRADWLEAFKAGKSTYGDFLLGAPISDMANLGAISLRMGGKRLLWDAQNMKITNLPEANKYLFREYRKGWELHKS